MSQDLTKLIEDVGFIKGKVECIDKSLTKQNGTIADLAGKVQRHDIIFGKIGIAFTALIFVATSVVDFLKDYVQKHFL